MKLISIIIPTYKAEKSIQQTITSVLSQTYGDFEVIIVDDESPERSLEICQQFNAPRLRIIHQKNRGLSGARKTGIRQVKGGYLAFLDADALGSPEKLALHVQHLENNPEVWVSFSRTLSTLIAAYLLKVLPLSIYPQLEEIALKVVGYLQQRKIAQAQLFLYIYRSFLFILTKSL